MPPAWNTSPELCHNHPALPALPEVQFLQRQGDKISQCGPNSKQSPGNGWNLLPAPKKAGGTLSCWSPSPCRISPPSEPSTSTKAGKVSTVAQGWPGLNQAQANLSFHPRQALLKAPTWVLAIPSPLPGVLQRHSLLLLPSLPTPAGRARHSNVGAAAGSWDVLDSPCGTTGEQWCCSWGCSALAKPILVSGCLKNRLELAHPQTSAPGKQQDAHAQANLAT